MVYLLVLASMVATTALTADSGEQLVEANGFVFVHVRVNQRGPFLFLLDTGATSTSVTQEVARAAGLVPRSRVVVDTVAGQEIVPAVPDAELLVAGVAVATEVLVTNLKAVRSVNRRISGVLGQNFLSRRPCLIDYRARRLWLGDEALQRARDLPVAFEGRRVGGRLALSVAANAGSVPLQLVLDSGSQTLVLSCGKRCPRIIEEGQAELRTNTGSRMVRRGALSDLTIGDIRIHRPKTVLVEGDPPRVGEDGLLPARWFSAVFMGPGGEVALGRWR